MDEPFEIISCLEAKTRGLKLYYTGKVCINGHINQRRVRDKACVDCRKDHIKRYKKTENWKRAAREHAKRYAQNPDNIKKVKVRPKITSAIVHGKLKRQPCEVCGSEHRIHAHHDDYSKPLDIAWLCAKHHHQRHKELEAKGIVL